MGSTSEVPAQDGFEQLADAFAFVVEVRHGGVSWMTDALLAASTSSLVATPFEFAADVIAEPGFRGGVGHVG
jgi:hypothetical protein